MRVNSDTLSATKQQKEFASFIEKLRSIGEKAVYKKGEFVYEEGKKADFLFIVESGVLRTQRWVNDNEVVLGFTFKGDIEGAPSSFFANKPNLDTIDAVCEVTGVKIYQEDFYKYLPKTSNQNEFITKTLLYYIEVLIDRYLSLKAYTAEENYLRLLKKQPELLNEIPLKDIASFLGITKERLSRIRKKNQLT